MGGAEGHPSPPALCPGHRALEAKGGLILVRKIQLVRSMKP